MIAVAVAVIAGVVAVTCGIVADSNHADSLAFLGVMVKTTAAQIFLTGAICTWAVFAALWLLSVGVRRSKQRSLELRALRAGYPFGYDDADLDLAVAGPGLDRTAPHVAPPLMAAPPFTGVPPFAAAAAQLPAVPPLEGGPLLMGGAPQPFEGDEPTLTEEAFADDRRDAERRRRRR